MSKCFRGSVTKSSKATGGGRCLNLPLFTLNAQLYHLEHSEGSFIRNVSVYTETVPCAGTLSGEDPSSGCHPPLDDTAQGKPFFRMAQVI